MTSYYAYTVFGVRLEVADLYKDVHKRGCEHPETEDEFCGQCGKQMWIDCRELVFDDGGEPDDPACWKIGDFVPILSSDGNFAYIGQTKVTSYDETNDAFTPIDSDRYVHLMASLIKVLEPLGLWDVKKYGVWTVLYYSY